MRASRIALFACAYNEVDGVANTVHRFEDYARRHRIPMLIVNGGYEQREFTDGSIRRFEYRRKFPKFPLDKKHDFDLLFWRYFDAVKKAVADFRPDLVHITGPSDVGMIGALVAHRLHVPLVASWHTNLHEYAEQRALPLLPFAPSGLRKFLGEKIGQGSLKALGRFYHIPRMLFAPNAELIELLQRITGKECHLMSRGVDVDLFSPERRTRQRGTFTLGYVGRITTEKNVEMLVRLENDLLQRGATNFRFLVVGQGASEPWLRENLKQADFAGVLRGEKLAEAYANMDAFVFPSRTDTFGNVVLEALASGVPAIVTDAGGPKFIVRDGETGFVARNERQFAEAALQLIANPEMHRSMSRTARAYALAQSWDSVFDHVFDKYCGMLTAGPNASEDLPTVSPRFSTAGAQA